MLGQFPYYPSHLTSVPRTPMIDDIFPHQPSDVLDLHNFRFEEFNSLLDEFIWSCRQQGFRSITIIHGKGTGAARELVHQKLRDHTDVRSFHLDGENWGKTVGVLSDLDGSGPDAN